jgi:uncharacterized damage-inducible protein DinB
MNSLIVAPAMQFDINARFFANALDGLSDAQFARRAAEGVNSIQWLAAHLTNARARAAWMLGSSIVPKWDEIAGGPKGSMRDDVAYPSRQEVEAAWAEATTALRAGLELATDESLERPVPVPIPLPDPRVGRVVAFLALHETYHLGQMALLRKQLGAGPMRLF